MDEAAVPAGPAARNDRCPRLGIGGKRGPLQLQLWASGVLRERGAPVTQHGSRRVPVFRPFQALDKGFSPCRTCWDRSLIHVECRPPLD
eukprot:15442643-Alexandrium_andersonii.AAC.1